MTESTMQAVRVHAYGGPETLHLDEVPVPEPLPTEVRVRVHAAGVNPVDWKTRSGEGMADVMGDPPFGIGWDVAGVVDAVGFGVTTLQVGEAVFGMPWFPRAAGGYAQYVTAPSRQFAPAPSSVSLSVAAAAPLASLIAWQCLVDTARVTNGDRVLVHGGAGGVGHLAVQIAAARGATVIATASADQEDLVRGFGASQVVDYRTQRFEDVVDEVDVVVDLIGTPDYGVRSVSIIRSGGLYLGVPDGVDTTVSAAADARRVRATGILVEPDGHALAEIARLIDDGRLRVDVTATFPLAQAADVHRDAERGHLRGKLVLEVAS